MSHAHQPTIEEGDWGWAVPSVTAQQGVRGDPGTPSGSESTDRGGEGEMGEGSGPPMTYKDGCGHMGPPRTCSYAVTFKHTTSVLCNQSHLPPPPTQTGGVRGDLSLRS